MGEKIVVIGAGHGGLVAATHLSKSGYDVDIYEIKEKDSVSYPWYDDIRFDCFDLSGITPPDSKIYTQKAKWSFVSPDEKNKLAVPQAKPMEEVSIDRRKLASYLLNMAEENCKIHYNKAVQSLYLQDDKICGVIVDGKIVYADLVIDASGLSTPFKKQLPSKYLIPVDIDENKDIMHAYRAFFKRVKGSDDPSTDCTLYLKHLGDKGISWCNISPDNDVDILIGKFGKLDSEDVEKCMFALRKTNHILSEELIQESYEKIAVRHPISVMVADGYALIGDSAYMTMPLMGSGIESSMKAGKILSDVIIKAKAFTASALWEYQVNFYKNIGKEWAFIDMLKNWLLGLENKNINWVFDRIITSDDLALINTDNSGSKIKKSEYIKKGFILMRKPRFIIGMIRHLLLAFKTEKIALNIPVLYDLNKISAWQKKYEKMFSK